MTPIAVTIGSAVITHGERGDELDPANPGSCLCGHADYWQCPEWVAGSGTVGGLIVTPYVFGLWRSDLDEDAAPEGEQP